MSTKTTNRLEGQIAGFTLDGYPAPTSALFVLITRLVMGGFLLFAGIGKFMEWPFDASGYLVHGVDAASPVSGIYAAMAANELMLATINVIIPLTQVLIGIALILGVLVRLAALGGALQMMAFYLGGWEGGWLGLMDGTLVYAAVFLLLGALAAGRIAGLDRHIEQWNVGGQPLVERFPASRYLLG